MRYSLDFRSGAEKEFDEAAKWYDARQAGLGNEFVIEVQNVFDEIALRPNRYPKVRGEMREAPVQRFPYAVYY